MLLFLRPPILWAPYGTVVCVLVYCLIVLFLRPPILSPVWHSSWCLFHVFLGRWLDFMIENICEPFHFIIL